VRLSKSTLSGPFAAVIDVQKRRISKPQTVDERKVLCTSFAAPGGGKRIATAGSRSPSSGVPHAVTLAPKALPPAGWGSPHSRVTADQ
jgi:hypothetical protein